MEYFFEKQVNYTVDEAVEKIGEFLKTHGFGILTQIDVQKTLKDKVGAEIKQYRILGACNPYFAHEAVGKEDNVGLMLPCNIVVREDSEGQVVVAAINPERTIKTIGNEELNFLATRVRDVMQSMITNI